MAINLASKYSDQIAEVFTRASFIKGKTAETYDLTGVKTLKVYTPITVEEDDYDSRFLRCVELVREMMGEQR